MVKKIPHIDVLLCAIPRDLPITKLAVQGIKKYISTGIIYIAVPPGAIAATRKYLGSGVEVVDEREFTGGIGLDDLVKYPVFGFPERAGWYLQQFVKLGFARKQTDGQYYLIWDSDTIPLRHFPLFDECGTPFFTLAEEKNDFYWETYKNLFGSSPDYFGSFISQHIVVETAIACEMLDTIEARHKQHPNWVAAIMANLTQVEHQSLFSEYETYGYFLFSKYPGKCNFRKLPWTRFGALEALRPSQKTLSRLSREYFFAAFESWQFDEGKTLEQRRRISWRIQVFLNELRKKIGFKSFSLRDRFKIVSRP